MGQPDKVSYRMELLRLDQLHFPRGSNLQPLAWRTLCNRHRRREEFRTLLLDPLGLLSTRQSLGRLPSRGGPNQADKRGDSSLVLPSTGFNRALNLAATSGKGALRYKLCRVDVIFSHRLGPPSPVPLAARRANRNLLHPGSTS